MADIACVIKPRKNCITNINIPLWNLYQQPNCGTTVTIVILKKLIDLDYTFFTINPFNVNICTANIVLYKIL